MFKQGEIVEWTSQVAGISRTKKGSVVEVVPPNSYPANMNTRKIGAPRPHESYVIRASVQDGSEQQKRRTRLYWPLIKHLKSVAVQDR